MATLIPYLQNMYPLVGYFIEEWILVVFLLGQIFISSNFFNLNRQSSKLSAAVEQKRRFFFILRFTQFGFLMVLLCTLYVFIAETQTSNEFILLHSGNFFFRYDPITRILNFFILCIALHYVQTLMLVFAQTDSVRTYVPELAILILTGVLSLRLFIATTDLVLMLLLIELAAFCSVILIAMQSISAIKIVFPLEAAVKYFVINALAVTLLFFSVAFYYNLSASTNLIDISALFLQYPYLYPILVDQYVFTQGFFFFAYLLKLGTAPFHQWVADVYEGAETAITSFLVFLIGPALNFKLLLLVNHLGLINGLNTIFFFPLLTICGVACIIFGTFSAFYQTRLKRFVAYAGLTHLGFMLLALMCSTTMSNVSFLLYLIFYIISNLCFFTLLLFVQNRYLSTIIVYFNQLKTIFNSSTTLFVVFLVSFLSFAGLPPLAGFFGKAFVLLSLLDRGFYLTCLFLLIFILIGAYMYLRVTKISLFEGNVVSFYSLLLTYNYYNITTPTSQQHLLVLPAVGNNSLLTLYWLTLINISIVLLLPYICLKLFFMSVNLIIIF